MTSEEGDANNRFSLGLAVILTDLGAAVALKDLGVAVHPKDQELAAAEISREATVAGKGIKLS